MRNGADARLSRARDTYQEMILQVARDYPGIDPRTLAIGELVFFYGGLRHELKKHTRPTAPAPTRKPRRRKS